MCFIWNILDGSEFIEKSVRGNSAYVQITLYIKIRSHSTYLIKVTKCINPRKNHSLLSFLTLTIMSKFRVLVSELYLTLRNRTWKSQLKSVEDLFSPKTILHCCR